MSYEVNFDQAITQLRSRLEVVIKLIEAKIRWDSSYLIHLKDFHSSLMFKAPELFPMLNQQTSVFLSNIICYHHAASFSEEDKVEIKKIMEAPYVILKK